MLEPKYQTSLTKLQTILREMESVLVAFSGGVDSALVLKVAVEELGDKAIALTAISPTFPPEEQAEAIKIAQSINVEHILIDSNELEEEGYAQNTGNRCYFCKSELFALAQKVASERGIPFVLDGTITDDLGEHRPGLQAAEEKYIRHPLVEAGMNKDIVRTVAKFKGLAIWSKPAFACLGSRFPVGTRVTFTRIQQVQRVESHLRLIGLKQFRARWHELESHPMVRLELSPEDMSVMLQPEIRDSIVAICKAEGFRWVTMDLMGYQRGSLSNSLTQKANDTSEILPLKQPKFGLN